MSFFLKIDIALKLCHNCYCCLQNTVAALVHCSYHHNFSLLCGMFERKRKANVEGLREGNEEDDRDKG